MSSKSLPTNFKQVYQHSDSSIISLKEKSINESSDIVITNISSLSSSVKKISPLTKPWFNTDVSLNDSSTNSNKSWMSQRWSTVSGSLIIRTKNQKAMAYRLLINRQKRRTYPPSSNILKQEQKRFIASVGGTLPQIKKSQRRQSLVDILNTFYRHSESVSSSSSVSKRLGKILKKKGKQPYRKKPPQLQISTTEGGLEYAVIMSMFQPPPTISSKSSTPSTPIKFPTPPKRFSAIYVDSLGRKGKVDYKRPTESRSQQFLNLIHHGVAHKLTTTTKGTTTLNDGKINTDERLSNYVDDLIQQQQQQQQTFSYCINKYNTQLTIDSILFLLGFIFFPFWWVGAWLYFRRQRQEQDEEQLYYDNDLFSLKTIAYLNTIFSFLSLAFLTVIISLIIWLVKSS